MFVKNKIFEAEPPTSRVEIIPVEMLGRLSVLTNAELKSFDIGFFPCIGSFS